ncbi:CHRD domain-containing protein [Pedobacter sp. AK013]|uniref:CHRD domain-containing protein n=1 Tax=Pedobacter sp. AK013 TaxID=2723071 RepID=UPI0016136EA7|nr:CHRD domain-containing protein [Pedobacter sp. AK013]
MMKNNIFKILVLCAVVIFTGCTKGKELKSLTGATYTVTGAADGTQMVPATGVNATGSFSGWYDEQVNVLTFTLTWSNIFTGTPADVITSVKFYGPAATGSNGTLIKTVTFSNSNASGSVNLGLGGYAELSSTEIPVLLNGSCYYVVCTQKYPTGIIRGQLKSVKN